MPLAQRANCMAVPVFWRRVLRSSGARKKKETRERQLSKGATAMPRGTPTLHRGMNRDNKKTLAGVDEEARRADVEHLQGTGARVLDNKARDAAPIRVTLYASMCGRKEKEGEEEAKACGRAERKKDGNGEEAEKVSSVEPVLLKIPIVASFPYSKHQAHTQGTCPTARLI